jgi:hypothetical protein
MYLVGRNFYSRFLPEARAVAGDQAAAIVDARLENSEHHAWLADPAAHNPILGYEPPPPPAAQPGPADGDASAEPEQAAAQDGDETETVSAAAAGAAQDGGDD